MSLKNTEHRYGEVAKTFHWLIAAIMVGVLCLGFYMKGLESSPFKFSLYGWHKSFGTLALFVAGLMILWRAFNRKPDPIASHKKWERSLAHIVHWLLYISMIGMPLSGWVMSSAGDFQHSFFGLFEMPDIVKKDEGLFKLTRDVHEWLAFMLLAAVGLHFLGAMKHHLFGRDGTMYRMVPAFKKKLFAGVIVVIATLLLAATTLFAGLYLYEKTVPREKAPAVVKEESVPAAVEAETAAVSGWAIDHDASTLTFSVEVQGKAFEGVFESFDGAIMFDPDDLENSHAKILIDIASVKTGSDERDEYIVMQPWMNEGQYPQAVFETTSFTRDGDGYIAHADLTMRGVSLPVTMPFTLVFDENDPALVQMSGSTDFMRLDYKIGEGDWSDPALVSNKVAVNVELTARLNQ